MMNRVRTIDPYPRAYFIRSQGRRWVTVCLLDGVLNGMFFSRSKRLAKKKGREYIDEVRNCGGDL